MADVKQTVLKFLLRTTDNPMTVMSRFHPQGQTVLNKTEWRGKEPRSCGITRIQGHTYSAGSTDPFTFDIEVSYRPKGCITYVGDTRYDGWTAMLLDRMKDGTLLDGHGNPLKEGHPLVYLPYELFHDIDFNDIDFGEFVKEEAIETLARLEYHDVLRQIQDSGYFSTSVYSSFMAPRKQRPSVKIILTNTPSGTASDGFGTRVINIDASTPQLQQVIVDRIRELVSGFMEGRYSIPNVSSREVVFIELSEVLVDCRPNETGGESRFNCLQEFVPDTFLEDLAKWLMANFTVDAKIVEGERSGLLLRKLEMDKK